MPVKFPSNLVHANTSFPVIAAADQTIQGLFFVADASERGSIPESKRLEGSIAVVGSTVQVYNGTGVSDASWQDVKNWVEVGGTESGADLDEVGVRASEFQSVQFGSSTANRFTYLFEDNVGADSDTAALVFQEFESIIPTPADNQSYADSEGTPTSQVPMLTFAVGNSFPPFNGGPPSRITALIHISNMYRQWSNNKTLGPLNNFAFPSIQGGTIGYQTFKNTFSLTDTADIERVDEISNAYTNTVYVPRDREISNLGGHLKNAMSNGIDGGTF
tara:strand:- start:6930 stop:7754 length:825 start_codon:yes stop_codon:yes gene_type:complete